MREDWTECCFEDLLDYEQPTKYIVESTDYNDSFKTPVLTAGKSFIKGYTNETEGIFDNLPTIIFDDFTTASQFVNFKFKVKSSAMKILVPTSKLVNMDFAYYAMQVNQIRSDTHKRYWISVYAKKKFLLPSAVEQDSIVSKIEELISDLDKGTADLKKAQNQLKVYRQAVLKKAFENLEKETTLEEIKEDSLIGLVRASGLQNSNGEGTAYLKMDKIDMIGNIELEDLVYVETNEDEIKKYALKTGDILINTRNSYELVGKTGIVRNINKTVVFNNNIMRIRVNESYDPYFICYQLISPFVRKQMDKFKKATTSVCALYQRNLFPLKLKVTDIKEQHQIVQEIESRLSVCDKVKQNISQSLEKAKALRQSILKKAFDGTLLSAEEIAACKAAKDYESASLLLKKIKAEKNK